MTAAPLDFFALSPDRVLAAVDALGSRTTGLCYALPSLENRVYEVELEDGARVVAKFYRPGRWSRDTILDEHRLLARLVEAEIPACAPLEIATGETLRSTPEGILYALFPRVGGRSPDELAKAEYTQLGRLLARIHNVAASAKLCHRPVLSPRTYGADCLQTVLATAPPPGGLARRYADAVEEVIRLGEARFAGVETFVCHADCHRGNLLFGKDGWFFLDFDDAAVAPPVQDLWLILPARPAECTAEVDALLAGYESFRPFDRGTLRLIEVLRALRYVRYAAWIASRWEDPSFPRAFPYYGTEGYWEGQIADLYEQLELLRT